MTSTPNTDAATISDEEIAGLVGMLRSIANGACVGTFSDERDLAGKAADMISRLHTRALLARRMAIEEAARVCERAGQEHFEIANKHMENRHRVAAVARASASGEMTRIAARIRSLSSTPDIEAMVERAARALARLQIERNIKQDGKEAEWDEARIARAIDYATAGAGQNFHEQARAVITAIVGK